MPQERIIECDLGTAGLVGPFVVLRKERPASTAPPLRSFGAPCSPKPISSCPIFRRPTRHTYDAPCATPATVAAATVVAALLDYMGQSRPTGDNQSMQMQGDLPGRSLLLACHRDRRRTWVLSAHSLRALVLPNAYLRLLVIRHARRCLIPLRNRSQLVSSFCG